MYREPVSSREFFATNIVTPQKQSTINKQSTQQPLSQSSDEQVHHRLQQIAHTPRPMNTTANVFQRQSQSPPLPFFFETDDTTKNYFSGFGPSSTLPIGSERTPMPFQQPPTPSDAFSSILGQNHDAQMYANHHYYNGAPPYPSNTPGSAFTYNPPLMLTQGKNQSSTSDDAAEVEYLQQSLVAARRDLVAIHKQVDA